MPDVPAHITGTVWKIEKKVGDEVKAGDVLVILESMKMEMPVEAPEDGRVAVLRPAALRWAGLLRAPAEAGRELFWYFGSYSCTSTPPGMVKYVTKP